MPRNPYEARRIAELVEAGLRAVRPHQCRCGADCLRGEDHDECALTVVVDTEPVDLLGEAMALIDRRMTFDIMPQTGKTAKAGAYVLYCREPWHYENVTRKYPVLVQHRCERA